MKRILLVDDDTDIVSILALRLRAAGFDVLTALDGLNGIKLAVEHRPDLILMDIWMPVGIGFSVAERLRALDLGGIPVIYMTASKSKTLRKRARQMGAAAFLEKPYTFEQLLAAIHQALPPDQPGRQAA